MFRRCLGPLYSSLLVLSSACAGGGDAEPETQTGATTYIGALADSDVRLAVVKGPGMLRAYVCGTGDTLLTHTRWFHGALVAEGETELVTDAWRLRLRSDAAGLRGELESPQGEVADWDAEPREVDDAASEIGLYQASTDGCRSGVIVWQAEAGPGCGAQGVYCDGLGTRSQVTPLECAPDAPLRVQAVRDGQAFEFVAERVQTP